MSRRITRRYYELHGSLHEAMLTYINGKMAEYRAKIKDLTERLGTRHYYSRECLLYDYPVAFKDEGQDRGKLLRPSKKYEGLLEPNRRTKEGRALAEEMDNLKSPTPYELFDAVGLKDLYSLDHAYAVPSYGYVGDRSFLSFPADIHWVDHPDMLEIKEWEYLKAIDAHEESDRPG